MSAAEVDEGLATIVAVGAPGSFRRRFVALLTGYQTLLVATLAIPLGLGLIKAFTSARQSFYKGAFGQLSNCFVPRHVDVEDYVQPDRFIGVGVLAHPCRHPPYSRYRRRWLHPFIESNLPSQINSATT